MEDDFRNGFIFLLQSLATGKLGESSHGLGPKH